MADTQATDRSARPTVWVDDLVAQLPLSGFAIAILLLCIAAGMTEGYDTQAMALAAPIITRVWGLAPHQTGLLLSGSLIGVVLGSFLLSPLGDRIGRRPSVLMGLLCAGLATFCGGLAPDFWLLLATRFVAGLGLGLAFANVIALAMEMMPARGRSVAVVLVNCGYPLGAGLGGMIAAKLAPVHGFEVIFFVGGVATLIVVAISLFALPESPLFLVRSPADRDRLHKLLGRLGAKNIDPTADYAIHAHAGDRSPVSALFAPERRLSTLLLWVINLANMAMTYFLVTWLPSIVVAKGATPQLAIMSISVFSLGGVLGGVTMALLLSRLGATIVLSTAYVLTIASTIVLCTFETLAGSFLLTLAIVGAVTGGSQFCLNAVVNQFYPSTMRATAAGYATGVGRFGAIIAPAAGVAIMSNPKLVELAFAAPAVPATIALAALLVLQTKTHFSRAIEGGR